MEQQAIIIEKVTEFSSALADSVRKLSVQIGSNNQILSDEDVADMINSSVNNLLVAKTETGEIVGMITLLVFRIPYVKKGYLDDLVVDEQYRGRGIANQLMEESLRLAREKGATYVDLTASPKREAGNNLYRKFGFEKRETNMYRLLLNYDER